MTSTTASTEELSEVEIASKPQRLGSLDAYRGLVMFLMMGGGDFWALLGFQYQGHVPWIGCTLHDLIQPSFSFLVGVAMPFSIASRIRRGQSPRRMTLHAWTRAAILIGLGIFLRSTHASQTNFTFEDTLTQIGLGYGILYWLGWRSPRDQWIALGVILVGYWAAFALYPLPGADFDYTAVGVASDWPHLMEGFAAHWNKNSNLAWAFDTWFLNLFPRESTFQYNGGGYATLSFIPTLGTMILGLLAGNVLRDDRSAGKKLLWLVVAGVIGLATGWSLNRLGICPSVKRIWTPSWTLFSGGWCFLLLAGFYAVMDVLGWQKWAYWLRVIGMNSIFAYCMAQLWNGFIRSSFQIHLGRDVFALFGEAYSPNVGGTCVLLVYWVILWWMARNKIFIKI